MATNNKALEKYAELMIKKISQVNDNDWKKPWFSPAFVGYPQNLSGRRYSNINSLLLYAICDTNAYKTPVFMTFNQIKEEGLNVKGEHSFPIIYYNLYIKDKITGKSIDKEFYNNLSKEAKLNYKVIPILKYYYVFNLDQTDFANKYPEKFERLQKQFENKINIETNGYHNPLLDNVIERQSWVCPIKLKQQNRAFYSPSDDSITLPVFEQFPDGKEFYYTALHEMAHSTGSSSRLNRNLKGAYGTEQYAHEELIAELSSAVTGRDMGLSVLPRKENAQYLKSWIKAITDDPKYLLSILNDVNKAVTMIENTINLEKDIEQALTSTSKDKQQTEIPKYKSEITKFKNLGYNNISDTIIKYLSSYEKAIETGSSANYKIKEVELHSSGARSLYGNIIINQEGISIENESLYIKDRSVGVSDKILNNIRVSDIPANDMTKLLSGGKINLPHKSEAYRLNKNLFGWEIKAERVTLHAAEAQASM